MKYLFLFAFFLALQISAQAQKPPIIGKYWVEFKDKSNSPYCSCRPWEFLSARALDRRARAGIAVVENDLPVNARYVDGLKAKGAIMHHTSRWLNAATVIADSATAAGLRVLPFVKSVQYVGRHIVPKNIPNKAPKKRLALEQIPKAGDGSEEMGYSSLQNSLLNMQLLYYAGVRGDNIWVAVMDGGFTNVDTMPFFDSIALTQRLIPGWDFVEHDRAIYEGAQHGTSVLSVMGANIPGYFVGTAPKATYFLLKTEDTAGEYPVEETNWIAGAEWADSIGADIINASLGYTSFNDTTLSHNFAQLNGRTAIGSRGASIAATKGMIICNSAGNSGDEPWRYVGVPADAPGIVAVGAIDQAGKKAGFSSFGPTSDGRIKPDLCAPGDQVVVAGNLGTQLGLSSGTSLASPMLAGAIASLWSAYPEKTGAEILDAVYASADQANEPDNARGYGLPNMAKAWLSLGGYWLGEEPNDAHQDGFFAFNADKNSLNFLIFKEIKENIQSIVLVDCLGRQFPVPHFSLKKHRVSTLTLSELNGVPAGAYQLRVVGEQTSTRMLGLLWR
ncbi:MAG: S8 family serine peptidase [Bacteroidota bacterium]